MRDIVCRKHIPRKRLPIPILKFYESLKSVCCLNRTDSIVNLQLKTNNYSFAVMSGDYTTSLTYLMKYPNVDVSLIIRHALHIQSPDIYERPICLSLTSETAQKQSKSFSFTTKSTTLPRRPSDTASNTNRENGRKHTISHEDGHAKLVNAAIVKSANDELVQMRLKNIQNTTALAAMRISQQSLSGFGEHDPSIVDGYLEDVSVCVDCDALTVS